MPEGAFSVWMNRVRQLEGSIDLFPVDIGYIPEIQ